MKRFLSITLSLVFAVTAFAQQKDVTKFLGIPVDGTKAEMIEKLKAKGFTINPYVNDVLDGEFNGTEVHISIVTNNNKVWRIWLIDANKRDSYQIRLRFNMLCEQFNNNKHYISLLDYTIPHDENIEHEMMINKKVYEAAFYQIPSDMQAYFDAQLNYIKTKYTEEQLTNPTEELNKKVSEDELSFFIETVSKKSVWFTIREELGQYSIMML